MRVVDIHSHLLSSKLKFDRVYDKIAIKLFGKKLGLDPKVATNNPYKAYTSAFIENINSSKYLHKSVIFGVDAKFDRDGNYISEDLTVCASNGDTLQLFEENRDLIIPFFSINPNRRDALTLIDRYYQLGFRGAKFLQNYWEVDLRDRRLIAYYKKLKEYNLPLIIHIGSESSIYSNSEFESIKMLDLALEIGVKVIAAHMALSYTPMKIFKAISKDSKNFNKEYFILLEMLESFDNLYADISAILTPVRAKVLRDLSKREEIHHKLLYGSDFPVPWMSILNSYDLSYKERFRLSKIENPHDRYIEAILNYFDKDNPLWSNYKKVL